MIQRRSVLLFSLLLITTTISLLCVNGTQDAWLTGTGGGGTAVYFDPLRDDVIGVDLTPETLTAMATACTFEMWVRFGDYHQQAHAIFSWSELDMAQNYETDGGLAISFVSDHTIVTRVSSKLCPLNDVTCLPPRPGGSSWEHIAMTWSTADRTLRMYRQGLKLQEWTSSQPRLGLPLTQWPSFVLGQEADEYSGGFDHKQAFDGIMDNVRVWSYVRSQTELATSASVVFPPGTPGLVISYDFDVSDAYITDPDSGPDLILDRSGNGNHARRGWLPFHSQRMTYSTGDPPAKPSMPRLVYSGAPISGSSRSLVHIRTGPSGSTNTPQSSFIQLAAIDASGNTFSPLQIHIDSLPQYGTLSQLDGTPITAPGTLVTDPTAYPTIDFGEFRSYSRIQYTPLSPLTGLNDYFNYSMVGGQSLPTTVYILPPRIRSPANVTLTVKMNEVGFIRLWRVNDDTNTPVSVRIRTLPDRGHIYQGAFLPNNRFDSYDYINLDPTTLVPITDPMTNLTTTCVTFQPLPYDATPDGQDFYTIFEYEWILLTGGELITSTKAYARVIVVPENHPPAPIDDTMTPNLVVNTRVHEVANVTTVITLQSHDPDKVVGTPQPAVYTISKFPLFGTLFQVDANGQPMSLLVPSGVVPTIASWVHDIKGASSQWSECYTDPNCPNAGTQPMNPCVAHCADKHYHVTQLIGKPDTYPYYGDSPLQWSFYSPETPLEFVELSFDIPVFVNEIDIYESWIPGGVVRVLAAEQFTGTGNLTNWVELWHGVKDTNLPEAARIFRPPVCPTYFAASVMRIEIDNLVSGWREYDAMQLFGTPTTPHGRVLSRAAQVAYQPMNGVHLHQDWTSRPLDSFQFEASDCMDESTTPGTINVYLTSPATAATMNEYSHFKVETVLIPTIDTDTNSASTSAIITINVDELRQDLHDRTQDDTVLTAHAFVMVKELSDDANPTAGNWLYHANGQLASSGEVIIPSTAASSPQLYVRRQATQGHSYVSVWVTFNSTTGAIYDGITYRLKYDLTMDCGNNYVSTASTGVCTPCYQASDADIATYRAQLLLVGRTLPECVVPDSRSIAAANAIISINTICLFLTLCIFGALAKWSTHPVILASSVRFNAVIVVAAVIMHICIYLLAVSSRSDQQVWDNSNNCQAMVWLGHTAFTLAFAALFAKTHRLAKIFGSKVLQLMVITDGELFRWVGGICGVMQVYLIIWTAVNPLKPQVHIEANHSFVTCEASSGANKWWGASPLIYDAALLIWGTFLCIKVRNVPSRFNESKLIAAAVYNILLIGSLVLPLHYFLLTTPDSILAVTAFSLLLVTLSLLFIPKIYVILFESKGKDKQDTRNTDYSAGGADTSFIDGKRHTVMKPTKKPPHMPTTTNPYAAGKTRTSALNSPGTSPATPYTGRPSISLEASDILAMHDASKKDTDDHSKVKSGVVSVTHGRTSELHHDHEPASAAVPVDKSHITTHIDPQPSTHPSPPLTHPQPPSVTTTQPDHMPDTTQH